MKHLIHYIVLASIFISMSMIIIACSESTIVPDVTETIEPYITINGKQIAKNTAVLDLSNTDIDDLSQISKLTNLQQVNLKGNIILPSDIELLQSILPECDILWDVSFGDSLIDNKTTHLDLSTINTQDYSQYMDTLKYLTNLESINLTNSEITIDDYILLLSEFPNIDIDLIASINRVNIDSKENYIDLSNITNIDKSDILDKLQYFTNIDTVDFGTNQLQNSLMDELINDYPNVQFLWNIDLLDSIIHSSVNELNLSGKQIDDYNTVLDSLGYLRNLDYVDMCDCGLSNQQMENLIDTYPDIKFVWKVFVGGWELKTDIKAFSTGNRTTTEGQRYFGDYEYLRNEDAANLIYCTDLIALDIGHHITVTDFEFLDYLLDLRYLIIAVTGISDLSPLTANKKLEYLEVFITDVTDLSPLLELPNLYHLNCSYLEIDNINALKQMTQLQNLWIVSCGLSPEELEELQGYLPTCRIMSSARHSTGSGWRSEDNQVYIDMMEIFGMKPSFSK